jgi:hypothetical protein
MGSAVRTVRTTLGKVYNCASRHPWVLACRTGFWHCEACKARTLSP